VDIYEIAPRKKTRKNPETVVVSGFSAPISKSVLLVGASEDNGLKQKSSRNEIRYDYSIWQVAPI